jgi:signal transduction histidine kinase/ActR/RegA family two-component response regulator
MRKKRSFIHLEKVHRIAQQVMGLTDLASLAEAMRESMIDYMDICLAIVEKEDIVLYASYGQLRFGKSEKGLIGHVVESGRPILVNDVHGDPRYLKRNPDGPTKAELVVPIFHEDQVIGALDLHSETTGAFSETDLQFGEALAGMLSIAIRNSRLYGELNEQIRRFDLIEEMASDLSLLQPLPILLDRTIKILEGRLGYLYVGIALIEGDELVVKAINSSPALPHKITRERLRVGKDGVAGLVASTGSPILIEDTKNHPQYLGNPDIFRSSVIVPVKLNNKTLGVINVENPEPNAFTWKDVRLIQTVASQIAIAIENARLYQALEETQTLLVESERIRAVGELAAGVAHNFNNLLTSIVGYTELLQMESSLIPFEQHLSIVMQSAQQGARIARQLQDFTRLRSNGVLEPVDLNEVIRQAVQITRPQWEKVGDGSKNAVRTLLNLDPTPPVMGNRAELAEVFTNLIFNALDAMPKGGKLTFTTGMHEKDVVVRVSDTGAGMRPEVSSRIFEPFFTTKGPTIGLGLGLSVVHGIVQRHGGAIQVESRVDHGTTFTLLFPAHTEEDDSISPRTNEPIPAQNILIIDDDVEILGFMAGMLKGHHLETTSTGEEGVELFRKRRHDFVFVDIGLPGVSGWNVTYLIRQADPGVYLVVMTGWSRNYLQDSRQAGEVDDFIAKPFFRPELLRILIRGVRARKERHFLSAKE